MLHTHSKYVSYKYKIEICFISNVFVYIYINNKLLLQKCWIYKKYVHYIHLYTHTWCFKFPLSDLYFWERYVPHYPPPSYVLNNITTVFLQGWLQYQIICESWYAIKQGNQNQVPNIYGGRVKNALYNWCRSKLCQLHNFLSCRVKL